MPKNKGGARTEDTLTAKQAISGSKGSRFKSVACALGIYAAPSIVVFSIALLAFWPGILVNDTMVQWHQAQTGKIDNWHPAYNTLYLLILSRICDSPGFILAVQIVVFSLAIATFFYRLEQRFEINRKYLFCCAVLVSLIPLNINAAILLLKDTMYAILSVFLSAITIDIACDKAFFKNWRHTLVWGFLLLCLCLTRHNGILAVAAYGVVIAIACRKQASVWVGLVCTIVLYFTMTSVGFQLLGITEANYSNRYAPASHVIARMLNTKSVEFTDEELEFLGEYVDVEELKESFNPTNMDYSIHAQNAEKLAEDGNAYLEFALRKMLQYPQLTLRHYLRLDSYLYNPLPIKGDAVQGMPTETDLWVYADQYPQLEGNSQLPFVKSILETAMRDFQSGTLSIVTLRSAWYLILTILTLVFVAHKRRMPAIALVGVVSIANTISLAPALPVPMVRYVYPIILVGYLVLVWFGYEFFDLLRSRFLQHKSQVHERSENRG